MFTDPGFLQIFQHPFNIVSRVPELLTRPLLGAVALTLAILITRHLWKRLTGR